MIKYWIIWRYNRLGEREYLYKVAPRIWKTNRSAALRFGDTAVMTASSWLIGLHQCHSLEYVEELKL